MIYLACGVIYLARLQVGCRSVRINAWANTPEKIRAEPRRVRPPSSKPTRKPERRKRCGSWNPSSADRERSSNGPRGRLDWRRHRGKAEAPEAGTEAETENDQVNERPPGYPGGLFVLRKDGCQDQVDHVRPEDDGRADRSPSHECASWYRVSVSINRIAISAH